METIFKGSAFAIREYFLDPNLSEASFGIKEKPFYSRIEPYLKKAIINFEISNLSIP